MARTARTRGISMTPEVATLWDQLRGDRRPAQFLRELLQREAERRREEEGRAALAWLEELRASLPPSWYDPELLRVGDDEHEDERNHPPLPPGAIIHLVEMEDPKNWPW
jgi:hypothetical protein